MLRAATAEDAHAIALVQVRAWRIAYEDIVPPDELDAFDVEEQARRWPGWIELAEVQVAEVAGRVSGFVATGPARDPRWADKGELYAIYVDPAAQGAGLGSRLLEAGEHALAPYGAAILWTFEANGLARRFYESRGWVHEPGVEPLPGAAPLAPEVLYRKAPG